MEREIEDLPNWTLNIDEVSAGVYRVKLTHASGSSVESIGTDIRQLTQEMTQSARKMEKDMKDKRSTN